MPETLRDAQVYGHYSALRVKWSCAGCGQRNDHALSQPVQPAEHFWCTRCRRRSTVSFNVQRVQG